MNGALLLRNAGLNRRRIIGYYRGRATRNYLRRCCRGFVDDGREVQLVVGDQAKPPIALLNANLVVLATGFERSRPGGEWLDRTVRDFALSCHECGYPIVDRSLCGYPGLYVVGLLAELELGPVARTIIGARHAASRVPATSRFVIKVA